MAAVNRFSLFAPIKIQMHLTGVTCAFFSETEVSEAHSIRDWVFLQKQRYKTDMRGNLTSISSCLWRAVNCQRKYEAEHLTIAQPAVGLTEF